MGSTVYMPAGTKQVEVEVFTNEFDATATVSNADNLKAGLNDVSIMVTSASGKQSRTETLKVYVYTKRTTKSSIAFSKSVAKITSKGTSSLNSVITKLTSSKSLVVTVSMPKVKGFSTTKNNLLLKQRTDLLVKLLSAKGIKPTKVTKSLVASGTADSLTITANYVN
jgi:hypothetical protein